MSKEELTNIYSSLEETLLPKIDDVHAQIKRFYHTEIKDFEDINKENDKVLDRLKHEYEQYDRTRQDIRHLRNKDKKFIDGTKEYLKKKEEEIANKKKILESINTGLKESVSKIKPQKLADLPYEKQTILQSMFKLLFVILFNEKQEDYQWEKFRKLALLHYKGEDFLTRMANIDFRQLPKAHYDELLILKQDVEFKEACQNSTFAYQLVDVADWVDYVCQGHRVNNDKKTCQHEYHKILKDKFKRGAKTTELKEEFCNEALHDIDQYQGTLMYLESELRTLIISMGSNVKEITELEEKRVDDIKRLNEL